MTEVEFQEAATELLGLTIAIRELITDARVDADKVGVDDARLDLHDAHRAVERVIDGMRKHLPPIEATDMESAS